MIFRPATKTMEFLEKIRRMQVEHGRLTVRRICRLTGGSARATMQRVASLRAAGYLRPETKERSVEPALLANVIPIERCQHCNLDHMPRSPCLGRFR